jgi:hypothetical protein
VVVQRLIHERRLEHFSLRWFGITDIQKAFSIFCPGDAGEAHPSNIFPQVSAALHVAEHNKTAIYRWKADSLAKGYELFSLLFEQGDFYVEVKRFLHDNGITYVDLGDEFHKRHIRSDELFWPVDGHFSPNGNQLVGKILSEVDAHD